MIARIPLVILTSASLFLLSSCQNRGPAIDTFGQLDSAQVAADTTMQVNMDRSYEYQKVLPENDTVVYDFLAYDKPKGSSNPEWESKFIVIRRTSSFQDTIIKDHRAGVVQHVSLCDLDQNGKPEIMFYEYPTFRMKGAAPCELFLYETNGRAKGTKTPVTLQNTALAQHYKGKDSFQIAANTLVRIIPYYAQPSDSLPSSQLSQVYKLKDHRLVYTGLGHDH